MHWNQLEVAGLDLHNDQPILIRRANLLRSRGAWPQSLRRAALVSRVNRSDETTIVAHGPALSLGRLYERRQQIRFRGIGDAQCPHRDRDVAGMPVLFD